jgi:SAM-dependent methyltransferase
MDLVCPRDRQPLTSDLKCPSGHEYPSYDGIPVLLREDVPQTIWFVSNSIKQAKGELPVSDEADLGSKAISSTSGYLYLPLVGKNIYPIPDIPLNGSGRLLDVGCGWGRWSIAAARKGYDVVAVDPALEFLLAARQVCERLGVKVQFVCADARYLPFPDNSFDQGFSFSVLQHFSKPDALTAIAELERVASSSLIELPGKYGIRALYHQAKRGFRETDGFNVRYWTPRELRQIGSIAPHAFFGTGVLLSDAKYLPWYYKPIPYASELLTRIKPLAGFADSYWLRA